MSPSTVPPSPLINSAAVAERLCVSERHVRRLVAERRLPYIRWGRALRFDPVDIDEWVKANHISPVVRTRRTA